MKSFKSTLVFAVFVLGIVAYAVYEYNKDQKEKAIQAEKEKVLPGIQVDQIKRLSFSKKEKDKLQVVYELQKNQDRWEIQKPSYDWADTSKVESFLKSLIQAKVTPVEGGEKVNWGDYGLDKPAFVYEVEAGPIFKIQLGQEAFDGRYYLRKNQEDKLLLGESQWKYWSEKTPDDFRDRHIFRFSPDQITQIDIHYILQKEKVKKKSVKLILDKDHQWVIEKNKKWVVDQNLVKSWKDFLKDLVGEKVIKSPKAKWFKPPYMKITLTLKDKKEPWTLLISSKKDGQVYLKPQRGMVYQVGSASILGLEKGENHFRDKKGPFKFDEQKVAYIELKKDGKLYEWKKEGGQWKDNTPLQRKVKQKEMQAFLRKLKDLQVEYYLNKTPKGIDPQSRFLRLLDKDKKILLEFLWGSPVAGPIGKKYNLIFAKTNLSDETLSINKYRLKEWPLESLFEKKESKEKAGTKNSKSSNNETSQKSSSAKSSKKKGQP
ncbi:MAG: DUF4340 domain-containing protein [Bdellovibrio sp.]|nr:MAG: DUF4340 domain-containing protein [Bdellovibrio sp.]